MTRPKSIKQEFLDAINQVKDEMGELNRISEGLENIMDFEFIQWSKAELKRLKSANKLLKQAAMKLVKTAKHGR